VVEAAIFERVRGIIAKQLGLEEVETTLTTTFEDLGVDSLDLFRIVIEIEEEFGIQIEDPEAIKNVKDAVDFVRMNTKKH
jgi:acyl carrier protein